MQRKIQFHCTHNLTNIFFQKHWSYFCSYFNKSDLLFFFFYYITWKFDFKVPGHVIYMERGIIVVLIPVTPFTNMD